MTLIPAHGLIFRALVLEAMGLDHLDQTDGLGQVLADWNGKFAVVDKVSAAADVVVAAVVVVVVAAAAAVADDIAPETWFPAIFASAINNRITNKLLTSV